MGWSIGSDSNRSKMKHSIFTVQVEYPTPTKIQPFAVYTKVDTWDIVVERMEENLPILKDIENGDLVIEVKLKPKGATR